MEGMEEISRAIGPLTHLVFRRLCLKIAALLRDSYHEVSGHLSRHRNIHFIDHSHLTFR